MPLPTSREETATAANPVSSNTINAIQDAIVDAHVTKIVVFPRPNNDAAGWDFDGDISAGTASLEDTTAADPLEVCLTDYMRPGQTLSSVRVWIGGGVNVTGTVYAHDFNLSTITPFGPVVGNSGSSPFLDIPAINTAFANELTQIWLRLSSAGVGVRVYMIILMFA